MALFCQSPATSCIVGQLGKKSGFKSCIVGGASAEKSTTPLNIAAVAQNYCPVLFDESPDALFEVRQNHILPACKALGRLTRPA